MILKSNPLASMFTYTLKGNTLTSDEAAALVEASSTTPIEIELSSLLNMRKVNSTKLFELSVQKKLPELAKLAWKISVSETAKPVAPLQKPAVAVVSMQKSPDLLLSQLHESSGMWAVGAAMIIDAANDGSWWTIRQVATHWANLLHEDVPYDSIIFKGFELVAGKWSPKELRVGVNRRETFHVSPTYIGLRDALKWLETNGLVDKAKHISQGSNDENSTPNIQAMSRVYYAFRLTEKGREMAKMWGDSTTFVINAFQSRLR